MTKAYGLVVVLLIAIFAVVAYSSGMFEGMFAAVGPHEGTPSYEGECDLPSAPTVTVDTADLYGGAAVTTKNAIRDVGAATFTEVAGAATFTADAGDKIEIVFGMGTDNDMDEPTGCKVEWTVPCKANPTVYASELCKDGANGGVIDDGVDTNLVVRAWDPEDGTVISDSAKIDMDNGDVFNIKTEWQGAFETDYGNRFTNCDNILVIHYNTSQYTRWKATDLNGVDYPAGAVPSTHTTAAGYTDKAFKVPVLKSNSLLAFYLVADASGSGKEPDGDESNVTVSLYDNTWFTNNDVSPAQVQCGVEDEDGTDIGSNGADSLTIQVAP